MSSLGGSRLTLDGKNILEHTGREDHEGKMDRSNKNVVRINLTKGAHDFSLSYYKNSWAPSPMLGLFAEGKGNYLQALHDLSAYPYTEALSSHQINPAQEPYILRCFINFDGKRKTYCVAVGDPTGLHYALDLSDGSLMKAWKGEFVDVTHMWHERGTQVLELPSGGLTFSDIPQVAQLTDRNLKWPENFKQPEDFQLIGYNLNKAGHPEFEYKFAGMSLRDRLTPDENGNTLTRRLQFSNILADTYFRVIRAKEIRLISGGKYSINDEEYFIQFANSVKPVIRQIDGQSEMLIPVSPNNQEISYTLIW